MHDTEDIICTHKFWLNSSSSKALMGFNVPSKHASITADIVQ